MTEIRCTHRYGYRSGEWADLIGVADLPGVAEGTRCCYLVMFPDGATDSWSVGATDYGYEFRETPDDDSG